jgi:hypothetical protein
MGHGARACNRPVPNARGTRCQCCCCREVDFGDERLPELLTHWAPRSVQEADEALLPAAEAVDAPSCDHVVLTCGGVLEQPVEAGALVAPLRSADALSS